MNEYSEIVKGWKDLYHRYYYQDMPFFRVIIHFFCKDNKLDYITPHALKILNLHYKNALNEYKIKLIELHSTDKYQFGKSRILCKKIQAEYQILLQIYDDLLNIQDMKNGKCKNTTRTTTKTDR